MEHGVWARVRPRLFHCPRHLPSDGVAQKGSHFHRPLCDSPGTVLRSPQHGGARMRSVNSLHHHDHATRESKIFMTEFDDPRTVQFRLSASIATSTTLLQTAGRPSFLLQPLMTPATPRHRLSPHP
ncbi:hypothetical protein GOBAR_AA36486 [Gossypium barbadense]|uniref:Uncharacterized protein n=1 Tax=Gossypium barbadense TaxID=3634 RepID=A0A2P5VZG6_GOSBA|nr:hypothetical protein GOBAR_AA36486 [Gossypium barbadense]